MHLLPSLHQLKLLESEMTNQQLLKLTTNSVKEFQTFQDSIMMKFLPQKWSKLVMLKTTIIKEDGKKPQFQNQIPIIASMLTKQLEKNKNVIHQETQHGIHLQPQELETQLKHKLLHIQTTSFTELIEG